LFASRLFASAFAFVIGVSMSDSPIDNLEKLLQNIADSNKRVAESNEAILKVLTKPESFAKRVANVFVSAVSALGILSIIKGDFKMSDFEIATYDKVHILPVLHSKTAKLQEVISNIMDFEITSRADKQGKRARFVFLLGVEKKSRRAVLAVRHIAIFQAIPSQEVTRRFFLVSRESL
jgi:hypothetical protein